MKLSSAKRGFTLIELLVVIAIIGILSSVVLASLGTARQKARDATRISDLKNLQLSLELYFDSSQSYPITLAANALPAAALAPTYIPLMPTNPTGSAGYFYKGLTSQANPADGCTAGNCLYYGLFVQLERYDNAVLPTDTDVVTTGGTSQINGTSVACTATAATAQTVTTKTAAGEACYDITP